MITKTSNLINAFFVTDPEVETPYQYPAQFIKISGKKDSYTITFNALLFNLTDSSKIKLMINYVTKDGESDFVDVPMNLSNPSLYANANIKLSSKFELKAEDIVTFNLRLLNLEDVLLDEKSFRCHVELGENDDK